MFCCCSTSFRLNSSVKGQTCIFQVPFILKLKQYFLWFFQFKLCFLFLLDRKKLCHVKELHHHHISMISMMIFVKIVAQVVNIYLKRIKRIRKYLLKKIETKNILEKKFVKEVKKEAENSFFFFIGFNHI